MSHKFIFNLLLAVCLTAGLLFAPGPGAAQSFTSPRERLVFKGKVVGKSNKAQAISIQVDETTHLVKFDRQTIGVHYAIKDHIALVAYEVRQGEPYATEIKPKLVKLPAGVTEIKLKELQVLLNNRVNLALIDSRPAARYAEGHLPEAISIPMCKMKELTSLLPLDKDSLLVFYCGGPSCGMSPKNSAMAVQAGYTNVRTFVAGEPGWQKTGLPTYASYGYVCKGNIVLVDLRSADKAMLKRIPRSISMPMAELEAHMEVIPLKAPVVLYSDDIIETLEAMAIFHDSGYQKVSLVQGGFQGWTKQGGPTESGPLLNQVNWKRILDQDEVSLAVFNKTHNDSDPGVVVLDVRNVEEAEIGMVANAINIPLDQVCSRLTDIPQDKTVYVYCSTGARAEMATKELRKNNYDAFYLMAEVECDGNVCEFTE